MLISYAPYLLTLLHIFPMIPTSGAQLIANYTDFMILQNCGSSFNLIDNINRSWDSDGLSGYLPPKADTISSVTIAMHRNNSVEEVPYATARVFHSPFTYTFPVVTGSKFLRLYFYPTMYRGYLEPTVYSDYDASLSFFSVTANGFTLLQSNFSAFLNSPSSTIQPYFMKEFVIIVDYKTPILYLTFMPNTNSFAFVNGIEIVQIPDNLYNLYDTDSIMENLYRLNVGGPNVKIQDDIMPTPGDSGSTRTMFRAWAQDDEYIFGAHFGYTPHAERAQIKYIETRAYSAPPIVYTTSRVLWNTTSLEWTFAVDSGFNYLLRFHFCEIQLQVTQQNQRVFTISIDNETVEFNLNGDTYIPIFRDYNTRALNDGRRGKKDLRLSLFFNNSNTVVGQPQYSSAGLNGLEIFKRSESQQSLAVPNNSSPPVTIGKQPGDQKNNVSSVIYAVIGSVIGVVLIAVVVSFLILRRRWRVKNYLTTATNTSVSTGSQIPMCFDLCRHFLFEEIKTATGDFDHNFVIGKGGFGNVYKGFIDDGATTTAIKRLNPLSNQGQHEFLTEIEMLSKFRHIHLVSLIGYCDDNREMILVYDYMAHGSLHDHLYNSENAPLTWKQRLQICMGAAKGLQHLHSGTENAVIHRDVKSTNILLDEKWVAKISDFGLSKMGPVNESFTHITTNIKGTYGYLDPEYFSSHKLTRKSDVYAFGVVLFEVLSGRPAVDMRLEEEQHSLAGWARYCIREEKVDQLIDHNLFGQISPACLKVFVEIAGRCVLIRPQGRPAMDDVVMGLELALLRRQTEDPIDQEEENAPEMYNDNQRDHGVISMDDPQNDESDRIVKL